METQGAQNGGGLPRPNTSGGNLLLGLNLPQKSIMGVILVVALLAFELFNFDTTRYALSNLLGDVRFAGIGWASILATAFCAIDFAGLARLFTPEQGKGEPKAVWYLMGAWLLGATMNAVMTWWAISLTLLTHDFGNEVLSREQLLRWVPFFVATLVWLTRILFIGAISVAGEYMFAGSLRQRPGKQTGALDQRPLAQQPLGQRPLPTAPTPPAQRTPPGGRPFRPSPAPLRARPQEENGRETLPPHPTPPATPPRRRGMQAPGRPSGAPRR